MLLPLLFAVGLSAGAMFCLFGYFATFEPVSYALQFRVLYAAAGAALLTGAGYCLRQAWLRR